MMEDRNVGTMGQKDGVLLRYNWQSRDKIKIFSEFYTQYSTIPSFHSESIDRLHPSGVKSKPGPLGSDLY